MSAAALKEIEARKFLLVDDHAGFRKLVRDLLVRRGGVVVECGDGADTLAAFEAEHPDCVLMDIEMPVMDGLAATRALCAAHVEAQVVIVTQHDSPAMREASSRAGARAFVRKDDLSQLISLLSALEVRPADRRPSDTNQ
jgi:DNA-binding NarL/FixJ family response regulator